MTHNQLDHTVHMEKPPSLQELDIADLHTKVKAAYVNHLESERERYKDLLRKQLIESEEAKLQAQRESEERKRLDAIEKQVQGCYSPLIIPS